MDVALEPDGRIVVAGPGLIGGGTNFALVRFLAAGPQMGSFAASPNPVTAGSSVTLTAGNIQDANPGATSTQVANRTFTLGKHGLLLSVTRQTSV